MCYRQYELLGIMRAGERPLGWVYRGPSSYMKGNRHAVERIRLQRIGLKIILVPIVRCPDVVVE